MAEQVTEAAREQVDGVDQVDRAAVGPEPAGQLAGDPVVPASDRGGHDHDAPFAADDPGPRPEPVSHGHPTATVLSARRTVRSARLRRVARR